MSASTRSAPPKAPGHISPADEPPAHPTKPANSGGDVQRRRRRKPIAPYLLLIPAVVVLAIALGYPLLWQLVTSFEKYTRRQVNGVAPVEWIWLENYLTLATDEQFWAVAIRSIAFCLVTAALTVLFGVLIALLMNAVVRPVRLTLQIAMLLAWAMPVVASMTVFRWLFDTQRGVINWLLVRLGFENMDQHNWLIQSWSFYLVACVIIVWASVPFVAFSVYAGLTQVPKETMEAAEVDGASPWRRFWSITVPMVRPVLMIVILLQLIWDLRVFTQIKMLQDATKGSGTRATDLFGTYLYGLSSNGNFGLASAGSVFVLVLTVAVSAFYIRILLRDEDNV